MIQGTELCLLCGDTGHSALGVKDERTVVECTSCGFVRTLERAPDYIKLYTKGDAYHVDRGGQTPYRERFEHDVVVGISRLEKFAVVAAPRWLDVGCANGGFLRAASATAFSVEGLELNPGMASWAQNATNCVVHTVWRTVEGLFDVISLHDVIEHVQDPDGELQRIRQRLTATGFLILDTPDAGHPEFISSPMTSRHTKPLEHLWFFREEDLRLLLKRNGFVVQKVDRPIAGKLVLYARPKPV